MKVLAKRIATFGSAMTAFGVQQVTNITLRDDSRIPIAAFDDVSDAALAHCKGSVREVHILADKLQAEAIETVFWMFSRRPFGGLLAKHGTGGDLGAVRAALPGFDRVQGALIKLASVGRHDVPRRRAR